MKEAETIFPLFSTPLYCSDLLNQNYEEINEFLYGLEYGRMNLNNGALTTNMDVLECPELANLKTEIERHNRKYITNTLFYSGEWYIHTSWAIIHKPGDYGGEHIHPNSIFSGVVYLNVHESSGLIRFKHPQENLLPPTIRPKTLRHNIYNMEEWAMQPPQGGILIFPSHLKHLVDVNESDIDRLVLAYNVFVRGEFGNPTSNLTLK